MNKCMPEKPHQKPNIRILNQKQAKFHYNKSRRKRNNYLKDLYGSLETNMN